MYRKQYSWYTIDTAVLYNKSYNIYVMCAKRFECQRYRIKPKELAQNVFVFKWHVPSMNCSFFSDRLRNTYCIVSTNHTEVWASSLGLCLKKCILNLPCVFFPTVLCDHDELDYGSETN